MVMSMNLSPELCILSETVQHSNILYHSISAVMQLCILNIKVYENQIDSHKSEQSKDMPIMGNGKHICNNFKQPLVLPCLGKYFQLTLAHVSWLSQCS